MNKLDAYRAKRDFRRTPEPAGKDSAAFGCRFVIQKHDASRLHYDFRLEVDGVLKSWAIPKGPSTDPRDKRLAVATEDHPLEYADFEGVIPEGEYGGGTVMIWDEGEYRNLSGRDGAAISMSEALTRGHVHIWLAGQKLRGGYALIRFKGQDNQWLLVKVDDDEADARRNPVSTEPNSVRSGRSLQQIAAEAG